ncbi:MAG TPA: HNH endonuclease [Methylococcaceae bacterium]|nr:HNH endonuclease [Methylococcaceae bacterium]
MKPKLRPCRKSGCPLSHRNNKGYCDKHKELAGWGKRQKQLGNRHARGYGSKWDKIRLVILNRDKYLCQEHLSNGLVVAGNNVDHIISKSIGGTDKPTNLQVLCTACHRIKTATEKH